MEGPPPSPASLRETEAPRTRGASPARARDGVERRAPADDPRRGLDPAWLGLQARVAVEERGAAFSAHLLSQSASNEKAAAHEHAAASLALGARRIYLAAMRAGWTFTGPATGVDVRV